eukprot:3606733-Rhodomonas_salina.1
MGHRIVTPAYPSDIAIQGVTADCNWGCGQAGMTARKSIWILDPLAYTLWRQQRSTWPLPEGALQARRWLIPVNIPNTH